MEPEHMTPEQYAIWKDGYQRGVKAVAGFAEMWNSTFAKLVNGYRFSDMILCKFNVVRRKHPRKAKRV